VSSVDSSYNVIVVKRQLEIFRHFQMRLQDISFRLNPFGFLQLSLADLQAGIIRRISYSYSL